MNRKIILVILFFVLISGFAVVRFKLLKTIGNGGLRIVSNVPANIFIDDKLIGKTPYEDKLEVREYVVKLIPEDTSIQASSWQGKVKLNPSVLTFINRDLGPSELRSGGEILTLEKIPQLQTQLSITSQPEGAYVLLDGIDRGVTPLNLEDQEPGEHDVSISSVGFIGRTQRVQLTSGYNLNINFQLSISEEKEASPSSTIVPETQTDTPRKPYIVVKETETGFLRVRTGPAKSATEAAQIKPGEQYQLLDEKEGWYKISFAEGKEGWISSQYADKK